MALTKVIGNGLGAVTQDGAATFNEGSADVDFRVESNSNANMLFVNGGTDKVGINTNSPTGMLTIDSGFLQVDVSGTQGIRVGSTDQIVGGTINDGVIQSATSKAIRFYNGGTESMRIRSDGSVTKPLQPAFLVTPSNSNQTNINADGTTTLIFGTEIFDANDDFASNTFNAPVTGKYQINCLWGTRGLDSAANHYIFQLVTSNRNYELQIDDANAFANDCNFYFTLSQLCDMDAGDTAIMTVITAGGAAQVDINADSRFSGYLVA